MGKRIGVSIATVAAWLLVSNSVAQAQTTAGAPRATASVVVAKPHYVAISPEVMVNKPAAEAWKLVGRWCDLRAWGAIPCTVTSGIEGELGSVRSAGNEVIVGKTELSYTYAQPVVEGRPYNMYHGTLEARPVTATTSKLVYHVFYDDSMLADDAAREQELARRKRVFTAALQNMKILAEGGTLPPAPPR